jgi:integrase
MAEAKHELFDGRLKVYRRPESDVYQCSAFHNGRNHRTSTKRRVLDQAEEFAKDWYVKLLGKIGSGQVSKGGKSFAFVAKKFLDEFEVLTEGQRSPSYLHFHKRRLNNHVVPYFKNKAIADITSSDIQEYRLHRHKQVKERTGKPPAFSTMHQEIVVMRQVFKTALRHRWLEYMPDLSEPYRRNGKVTPRPWFSHEEYRKLYEATRKRAEAPLIPRWRWACEQLHDYVLFMANTGLRPDEANRLEYRDVAIVDDDATGERILEIEVRRGKRGFGYCKSTKQAVLPFERLVARNNPKPTDRIFAANHHVLFNRVLEEQGLKVNRDGLNRTTYSLRHTYICFRLMEGADIYQIAKNCRTSVEMIQKFYASHIRNSLDAAAINVMAPRKRRKTAPGAPKAGKQRKTKVPVK